MPITTKKYGPFTKIVIKWRITLFRDRQEKDICKIETTPAKEGDERVMGDGCGHSALYETVKKKSSKKNNCVKPLRKIKP